MGSSGNLTCAVFFLYSQEAYFTPWAISAHVTAGYVANIGSVSHLKSALKAGAVNQSLSPRSPHRPWCIVPSPEMLHLMVDSVCQLDPQQGWERATLTDVTVYLGSQL